jgi:addiction module HigA family antidote
MPCQHPGKILLQQYLAPQNISQNRLARAIKVPPRRINEIIHQKRNITADTAVRLAIYFGNSASYWMHLQAAFDIEKVKQNIAIQLSTIQPPVKPESTQTDAAPKPATNQNSTKTSNPKPVTSAKKRIMR